LVLERIEAPLGFLSTQVPGRRTYRMAQAVALLSLLVFVVAVPFAKVPLAQVPAFVPIYESALIVNDLITAVLLFGQFAITRSRALLVLAGGYLFTATAASGHMLSFPGLFAPGGLLGAGPQSTAWIYMFWHAGFPLFVVAYALLKRRAQDAGQACPLTVRSMVWMASGVLGAAAACIALATAGAGWLPAIMSANHYTPVTSVVTGVTWGTSLVALVILWRSRPHSTIDIWLMVVLCVWACDVALSTVFNAGRYDLGFYAGRIYGLLAASFVLLLLLIENSVLHSRLAAALAELKRLASTDPLTSVANRRAFETSLHDEWRRCARAGTPLSLLMIDVDFFKDYNDQYGHLQGDQCLTSVATCLTVNVLRGGDLVARYGGEEFSVLLPDTDVAAAAQIGQRLCDAVAALVIPHAASSVAPCVTVSVGVASGWASDGGSARALTEAADGALYAAKVAGRNRMAARPLATPAQPAVVAA